MRARRSIVRLPFLLLALLVVACPNVLMNDIQAKIASDTAKDINSFVLTAAANAKVYLDIPGVIDEKAHTISLTVPKWIPLTGLVATFQFQGASVTVNGTSQKSGVTAQDFSQPLLYTVTPASGSPVQYTVTAVTGAQGLMGGVIQGTPLNLTGAVTTLAGLASPFGNPMGVVRLGTDVYVTDQSFSVVWKVDANSGVATVLAGTLGQPGFNDATGTSAMFNSPQGLATDGTYLYVADELNERIRKIDPASGAVTTLAGQAPPAGEVDNATDGTQAKFNGPNGLYYDSGTKLLFETDKFGKNARTIDPNNKGAVATIIGSPSINPSPFAAPAGLVVSSDGTTINLYVADTTNNAIYKFGPVPTYTEIGSPFSGVSAGYNTPTGIIAYNSKLYVADAGNHVIKEVDPVSGAATACIGSNSGVNGHVDGQGASSLRLDTPDMIWVYSTTGPTTNTMYITEAGNNDVRSVSLQSNANNDLGSTLSGVPPGSSNGVGSAARFHSPRQLATNGATLWLSDQLNELLRNVSLASGAVGLLAGQLGNPTDLDGTGTGAAFNTPAGMTTDGKALYVCDQFGNTIRRVDLTTGAVTTFAGDGFAGWVDNVAGTAARFNRPTGITTDGTSLYVCDQNNDLIRRIDIATKMVTTAAGSLGVGTDVDTAQGSPTFDTPNSITTDGTNLFVAESANEAIRQIVIASGVVTTLAGSTLGAQTAGYVNATGTAARFRGLIGITTDGTSLYVADVFNHAIRKVDIASGAVTTLAGAPAPALPPPFIFAAGEIDSATATAARFNNPIGIVTDGTALYVADRGSNTIRVIH